MMLCYNLILNIVISGIFDVLKYIGNKLIVLKLVLNVIFIYVVVIFSYW